MKKLKLLSLIGMMLSSLIMLCMAIYVNEWLLIFISFMCIAAVVLITVLTHIESNRLDMSIEDDPHDFYNDDWADKEDAIADKEDDADDKLSDDDVRNALKHL